MKNLFYHLSIFTKIIPVNFLIKLTNQRLICPFYHIISNHSPRYLKHLYQIRSVYQFQKDLDYLMKHFIPIDFQVLLHHIQNNIPLLKNSFLLSFDDGLKEFHDVIAPILLKKGIPAICFLNSGFIDNKDMLYRFKQSLLYDLYCEKKFTKKEFLNAVKSVGLTLKKPRDLFNLKFSDTKKINSLANKLDFNFTEFLKIHQPYMSSKQIKSLSEKGFIFGGHSINHPLFSELSTDEQMCQITESINTTLKITRQKERIFSFPFTDYGISKSLFQKLFSEDHPVTELTFGCAGLKKDQLKRNIQRIPVEINNYSIKSILHSEYVYYIFRGFMNKNTVVH